MSVSFLEDNYLFCFNTLASNQGGILIVLRSYFGFSKYYVLKNTTKIHRSNPCVFLFIFNFLRIKIVLLLVFSDRHIDILEYIKNKKKIRLNNYLYKIYTLF